MSVDYRPEYDPADVDSDYGHTGGDITVPTFTANMKPFRFWCQKALPLVYDDSLSYYEVLCKVVKQMNDFLTDLQTATGAIDQFAQQFVINQQFLNDMADQLGQNVQDLEDYINDRLEDYMTAYTQLQNYVNNYFDNLDVQQEINNKLDEMAEDGTFNTLFDPVITAWMTAKTAQIDAAIANQDAIQAQQNGRISVLEGRMDTFSGLPSGSTSGNAELLDIRTNFLGETYPTAGDAVRASDMIASGFQSIGFSRLTEWNGNEADSRFDTIQIDVTAYKGGHMAVIANTYQFVNNIEQGAGIELFGSNVAGKTVDNNAHQYPFPDGVSGIPSPVFKDFTVLTTSVQDEERILIQLAIPEDFQYQYLKLGNIAPIPGEGYSYTQPAAIVYANSWSKTQVDPTLSIAGAAADAKATGDALDEVNERLLDGNILFGNGYTTQQTESGYAYTTNVDVGDVVNIDTPVVAENTASLVVKNITEGMRFKVFGAGTFNYLLWAWLDKDKKLISKAETWASSGANGVIITAPSNAEYLVCSSRPAYTYGFSAQYLGATVLLDDELSDVSITLNNTITALNNLTLDYNKSNELLTKGYVAQQTETGYAYKNNVDVGAVVNIDTPTAVANTASFVVKNITEGMRFKVFGNGTFNYLLWSWLDKDRKLISKANSWESSGSNGVIITAPSNAVYLVCSSSVPYTYGFSAQYLGATVILDNEISALVGEFDFTKTNANLLKNADFSFDFFSDIHGGDVNFQRIIQHAEDNNIDVIINGGDTALRYLSDQDYSIDWYATDVNTSTVDILSAVGNHDVWTGAYWTKANATDIYDTFIKPLVTKFTGIVQPASAEANGLCYYYKDYGAIRVIVLNAMSGDQSVDFWDTAQATWFENVLADAKTNNKHVIVCNHSPFPKNIALRDEKSNWNSWIDYRTYASSDSIVIKTAALDLIKAFMNAGGVFICLLTGHEHVDSILTATGYDGQFMINIASAKWSNHPDGITYSSTLSQYYDCFNYCTVDSTHGILKLVRVGWNMDEALKERRVLAYDYFNHKLINE